MASGEDHAHGALEADQAGQAMQSAGERGKADARFGQGEGGVFRSDNQVAGQRDFKTAAHGDAIDGGDDRLVAIETVREAGKAAGVPAALAALRLPLQIVTCRECPVACAGHDRDPLIGVLVEFVENAMHFKVHRRMHGIHHLGAIERDDGKRTLAVHLGEFIGHERFPSLEDFLRCIAAFDRCRARIDQQRSRFTN
jgi:hypothetical protein